MRNYDPSLKPTARHLRRRMTDAEATLWRHLRRRQILGVQFYRQKPLGEFVVDFFAPRVGLVVEVDGGQHWDPEHRDADERRDEALRALGLTVVRYSNREVLDDAGAVVADVWTRVERELREGRGGSRRNPPSPPFIKGGTGARSAVEASTNGKCVAVAGLPPRFCVAVRAEEAFTLEHWLDEDWYFGRLRSPALFLDRSRSGLDPRPPVTATV